LIQIALYSVENFGLERSEKYRNKLKKSLPSLRPICCVLSASITSKWIIAGACAAHSIYYRIEKKGVLILRILGQQDTSKAF
jgi:plasmid stabilization system protein ParE